MARKLYGVAAREADPKELLVSVDAGSLVFEADLFIVDRPIIRATYTESWPSDSDSSLLLFNFGDCAVAGIKDVYRYQIVSRRRPTQEEISGVAVGRLLRYLENGVWKYHDGSPCDE